MQICTANVIGVRVGSKGTRFWYLVASWWAAHSSGKRPTFDGYIRYTYGGGRWVTYNKDENTIRSTLMHLASWCTSPTVQP
eukprot:1036491-Prymnesium_polylepis.4